jgi:hypothetical protein
MRIIYFELSGNPAPGDFVNLCCRSSRGGRTDANYWTKPGDTAESVAAAIAAVASSDTGWLKEAFEIRAKGPLVIVQTSIADIEFDSEIQGKGTLTGKPKEI